MNKLSKHVLGMKFMRRTKEQVTTEKTESTFRHHFSKAATPKKESPAPAVESKFLLNTPRKDGSSCEIVELGSYSQCEGHVFGRQSFGGFNPVLEANVSKGIWKPFYLDPEEDPVEDDNHNSDIESEDDEVDVPVKEMAKTFGSLVGTLGKKFLKKRDRVGAEAGKKKGSSSNFKTKEGGNSHQQGNKNKITKGKKSGDKRQKGKGGRNCDSLTDDLTNDIDEPPRKRSKFMKPSE